MNKIFSFIYFTISLFLFGYIFYKSEFIFEGNMREHYFSYFILSFLLLVFSMLTFKLSKKINDFINILIFSIIISFYMFEYYLDVNTVRISVSTSIQKEYKKLSGKNWDKRSPYQVYRDLLKENPNVVPYMYPSELNLKNGKIFSLAGVSNSLTVFCNENGYFSVTNSDRYGFNNPNQEWETDETDYVFVGDSFTQGFCVNRPHDIPSVIREITNNKVLNLGYGSNGPLIEYAVLREYLPKNVKKIVFMYYGGNDLQDLNVELKNKILLKYLNDENFSQNLKELQNEIDYEKRKHIISRAQGQKFSFLTLRKTRSKLREIINQSEKKEIKKNYNFDAFEKILFLTKKLSLENKSELYFVYLHAERYITHVDIQELSDEIAYFEKIKSIVNKLDIEFIDIQEELFEKHSNLESLWNFGLVRHYGVEGYKQVAETIYKLTKN